MTISNGKYGPEFYLVYLGMGKSYREKYPEINFCERLKMQSILRKQCGCRDMLVHTPALVDYLSSYVPATVPVGT